MPHSACHGIHYEKHRRTRMHHVIHHGKMEYGTGYSMGHSIFDMLSLRYSMEYAMGGAMVVNHGGRCRTPWQHLPRGVSHGIPHSTWHGIPDGTDYPWDTRWHNRGITHESPMREALHYDASYVIFMPSNEFAPRIAPWGMPWSVPWVLG